jgi:hypothetical protein
MASFAASFLKEAGPDDPWMAAMRRGDFSHAWKISDQILKARLARGEPSHTGPRHFQSIWNGEPLAGKCVLVRCYHGLGDTIQFIRFVRPLRRLAKHVTVWAQPSLVSLVSTAAGVDCVLPLHDGVPGVPFDCDIEIMELAHALRVDPRSIACTVPYLFPRARQPSSPAQPLPANGGGSIPARRRHASMNELAVGLVWGAGDWDRRRSVPARLLNPLSRMSGVRLYSLQCGPQAAEAASVPAQDISSDDVETAAATFAELDLIISVDTFAAHLGGALGVPVWSLLHAACDWRWMEHRVDTVWYPTMHLFRQKKPGEWAPVIEEVAAALQDLVASGSTKFWNKGVHPTFRFRGGTYL